jgi:D-erythro-7,8-dihydroneopterin triphosphate epimerase
MAVIEIVDLKVRAIIGTKSFERTNKQELIINISLEYDAQKASRTDSIKDALDYEHIVQNVIKTVENSHCLLLEKLAAKVMAKLKGYSTLQKATLRIDKPQAIPEAKSVSYQISE